MTEENTKELSAAERVTRMYNHPWLDNEVEELSTYFLNRNLTPFEGAWVMSKLMCVALSSCVQDKEEGSSE